MYFINSVFVMHRLPTVQVKRTMDSLPYDLNQYHTIPIETRDPYTFLPKIQTYTAEVANQVRRAPEDSESGNNPISLYYPSAKLEWKVNELIKADSTDGIAHR
jgi:hypothetical protein